MEIGCWCILEFSNRQYSFGDYNLQIQPMIKFFGTNLIGLISGFHLLQVWFGNVPHTKLVEDKGGQNWISVEKNKFKFPGGGTQFIHGADQYLDQISKVFFFCS